MTEPTREQRIDAAMVRLDRDGMIAAFENDYGQKWTDPEWRTEVSIWAAAWRRGRAALAAGKDASPLAGSIGGGGGQDVESLRSIASDAILALKTLDFADMSEEREDMLRSTIANLHGRLAHGIGALPGPDSQQPHVALPRDGGTDKLGGC
jgi:hypothetical protein